MSTGSLSLIRTRTPAGWLSTLADNRTSPTPCYARLPLRYVCLITRTTARFPKTPHTILFTQRRRPRRRATSVHHSLRSRRSCRRP